MIEVREIWDNIEKRDLSEYLSKHETLYTAKELKNLLKNEKILLRSSGLGVLYFLIFLYSVATVAGGFFIYQGVVNEVVHRVIYGIFIILIGLATLYIWISRRHTIIVILLENGIVAGVMEKKILKAYNHKFSFLPYSAISGIDIKKASSELRVLEIRTKDGKLWRMNDKKYVGIMLNKKEVDKYLNTIYEQMRKVKGKTT